MKTLISLITLLFINPIYAANLEISLPEPEWLLPAINDPLSQREARIPVSEIGLTGSISAFLDINDYNGAVEIIDKEIDLDEADTFRRRSPALILLMAQIYIAVGRYEDAEVALLASIEQLPQFVRAHQTLGMLYMQLERYQEALVHLGLAASFGGINAELSGYLGYANQVLENYWGAVGAYQQALMFDPDNLQWQQGLLYSLIQSRQLDSALALVDELLVHYETDSVLWLYRAQLALRQEENEVALTSLEMALRLGDTSLTNMNTCAQLHIQFGSVSRAIELFSVSLEAGLDYVFINQTLSALINQGRWSAAEALISEVKLNQERLSDTEKSQLLSSEASVAIANNRGGEAREVLEQSIALNPNNAQAILQLADVYAQEKLYIQAELMYERATAFDSTRGNALLNHAQLAIDQSDYATALNLLREASAIYPQQYAILENMKILENILTARQN